MVGTMNEATIFGRLGADPDVKVFQAGGRIATLSVATTETWKDKATGEKKERVDWHRVIVKNDGLVGILEQYAEKGMMVLVRGKIETRKWTDQGGVDRYQTEIIVKGYEHSVSFFETAKRVDGGASNQEAHRQRRNNHSDDMGDDIPF